MSRRKQAHPRHIESEQELASLLENDLEKNSQCLGYESTAAREDYSDDEGGDTCMTTANIITPEGFLGLSEFHSSPLSNRRRTNSGSLSEDEGGGGGGDAHVCGKCRAEFVDLAEFLHHKKVCTRKRIVLVPEDDDNDEQVSYCEDSRLLESSSFMDRSLGMVYDKDIENNNLVRSSDKSENSSDSKDFEYMDRKSSDDSTDVDSNENMKMNLIPHLPHFPTSISHVLPDTNVKIEALENTKVAVAQFANNNFPPSDLASLQSTLYSLQQQQLFQLQLIQQLQQHLMSGTTPQNNSGLHYPSNPPNMIMSPQTSESGTNTQAPSPVVSTASNSFGGLGSFDIIQQSQASTPPVTQGTSPFSSASDMLRFRKGKPPNVTTFENKPSSEDPFFKHRCRYCGKVFGSDSALQIHIRSHTGERPFKCNVCGNRFSTKGNLKVHFSRHKVKYPHVRMNPFPIPEHLDKSSPPAPEQQTFNNTSVSHGTGSVTTSEISSVPATSLNTQISTPPIPQTSQSLHNQSSHLPIIHPQSTHLHSITSHPTLSHSSHPHSSLSLSCQPQPTHPFSTQSLSTQSLSTQSHSSHPHPVVHHQPVHSPSTQTHSSNLPPTTHPSIISQSTLHHTSSLSQTLLPQAPHLLPSPLTHPLPISQASVLAHSSPITPQPPIDSRSSQLVQVVSDTLPTSLTSSAIPNHGSPRLEVNNSECSSPQVCETTTTSISTTTTSGSAPSLPLSSTNNSVISTSTIVSPTQAENYFTSLLPKQGNLDNSWENLMEVTKTSETSKLQQLVDNIEHKLTDPNQCVICQRVLSCKSALQMHYRTHTGERPFKCKICGRAFTTKGNLRTHMGVHRTKPPMRLLHQCNVCHKKFTNALVLQQHIKLHTGEPTEMNPEQIQAAEVNDYSHSEMAASGYSSSGESSNTNVIKTETKSDVPKLSVVPSVPTTVSTFSTSLAALENHVKGIYTSVSQPISFAGRALDQMSRPLIKSDTPRSQSPVHNRNGDRSPRMSSPPLSCTPSESSDGGPNSPNSKPEEPVNMSTSSVVSGSDGSNSPIDVDNGALDLTPRPMSAEGHSLTSSRNTTCNICLKTFACYSALSIHYRSHTKERPFKCNVCDRGFSTKGNMKQHMLTHKIRDLPSQIFESTPKIETPNILMFRNENIPSADSGRPPMPESGDPSMQIPRRPSSSKHVCRVCTKPFSSSSALRIHMRTHTGDKPFKCTICERAFTTRGNLKVHMGTHMWNNGSSRRGRRMSIESPLTLSHNGNEFLDGLRHSTEMYYPYASPAFMNGLAPKVNEISVIQSPPMNNGMFPPVSLASTETMSLLKNNNDMELNLKKSPPPSSTSMSPVPPLTQAPAQPVDASKNASWVWKTTCNVCQKVCSSASALEDHIKVHVQGEVEKLMA